MTRIFLLSLLACLTFTLKGQDYFEIKSDSQMQAPRFAVKLVPSQLAWKFPSYAMAIEHRLNDKFHIEYKAGLIQDRDVFDDDHIYFADKSGFKSAVLFKMYAAEGRALTGLFDWFYGTNRDQSILPFVGLEFIYNEINFDRTRIFKIDCDNGCEFFQKSTYGINQTEMGARLNLGFLINVFNPIDMEFSTGIGLIHQDLTPDSRRPSDFDFMYGRNIKEEFNGVIPSLNLSIKLVYSIK